jgi:Mn2+/Fe2+ NRAMP family transporter
LSKNESISSYFDPGSAVTTTFMDRNPLSAFRRLMSQLGPGLLFAGAAIGVSHLVQSTRAGASYGLGLLAVVVFTHILKYPFFEFGTRYASSTGESLIKGYEKMGKWSLILVAIFSLGTIFTTQAAVTLVTATLAINVIGISSNVLLWVVILLLFCALILALGQYKFLDKLIKLIILVLSISTIAAVILGFGQQKQALSLSQTLPLEGAGLIFLVSLIGWLPAPIDISIWNSIWAVEKAQSSEGGFKLKPALRDFRIGYWGTMLMAVAFLLLGALVMYSSGQEFSSKGTIFAGQVIQLYVDSLGEGVRLVIGIAALTTMFSTTLTVQDGISRVMAELTSSFQGRTDNKQKNYWIWMGVLILGTLLLLGLFSSQMVLMVTIATILSFLTAPFFAWLNYRLIRSKHTPDEAKPGLGLKSMSILGMIFLVGFSLLYLLTLL